MPFQWKNKQRRLNQPTSSAFQEENQIEPSLVPDDVDWLNNLPVKKRKIALEDSVTKANRLTEEGTILAGEGRYREAIARWDEAITLRGDDCKILDMKAQALMELQEFYPAVHSAELAVSLNPLWWESIQTLGRAQLNLGEIRAAVVSFEKAVHLSPGNKELWDDDLNGTIKLWNDLKKQKKMTKDELSFHVRECMRVGIT